MMLNTVTSATPAQPAGTPQSPAAMPAATVPAAAGAATDTGASAPAGARPFALWLGQQLDVGMPASDAAQQPLVAAGADAQAALAGAEAAGEPAADEAAQAAQAQDNTLLAAMALPLMPLSPLQAAQVLQAMVPAAGSAGNSGGNSADDGAAGDASGALPATVQNTVAAPRGAAQAAVPGVQDAAPDNGQASSQRGGQERGTAAYAALAGVQAAQQPASSDGAAPATRLSVNAAGDAQDSAAPAGPAAAGVNVAAAGAPAPATPAADTVKLAGPPTAWRQSLQEALGERLNVQVTKNMEQAVIRLEPPQLGRIDIAIRHSAGTLEVNISASNGDVLRQLQTVSDNLRSDLSQRQFTEVAVTVAPTPKNTGSAPFGDPQQQGRGRQQGRDQESEPGRALAEAGNPSSTFSLDGRG